MSKADIRSKEDTGSNEDRLNLLRDSGKCRADSRAGTFTSSIGPLMIAPMKRSAKGVVPCVS